MRGSRDDFNLPPSGGQYADTTRGGLVSALLALGMFLVMIVGVFALSGGVGDYAVEADAGAPQVFSAPH